MPDQFQKPANTPEASKPNGSGQVVYSMPKEYRGGVAAVVRKPTIAQIAPTTIKVEQPKPIAPPPPVATPKPLPAAPQKKSALPYVVLVLGIMLLLAGGVIAYFAYQQTKKPVAQAPINVPPTITPTPEPTPTPTPTPEPPKKPEPGIDSDSDGLSDVEELRLYSTLVFNPDTDADSFLDGNEIFHLYDPSKINFTRLADSGLVKTYTQAGKYSLFLPVSFIATESVDGKEVTWGIPSGENMKVTAHTIAEGQALMAGQTYMSFTTKSGIGGFQSVDRLDTFLEGTDVMYRVEYLLGPAKAIDYRQTYAMMLNSFMASP